MHIGMANDILFILLIISFIGALISGVMGYTSITAGLLVLLAVSGLVIVFINREDEPYESRK
jgi:hypothetical protein